MGVDWCPYTIIWAIWKERYDRIFRKVVASFQEGLNLVKVRIGKWAKLKKACQNNNLGSILHNWEACLASGPFEGKRKKRKEKTSGLLHL